ncbi:condensation domain-containing protein [Clostridium polynesiense]|uniref:condensation domain-containing protein n=1 Tax=Clostridium polynesiense TaxID=1325933 RepID=UPI00058C2321|nr:condensation domain-containing protein [Clostridium polynesiense]
MNKELYPLTPAQHILFFSQKYSFQKQINNVSTLLLLEGETDFELLKDSALKAFQRMDSFRIRLTSHEDKIKQYFVDKEEPELHILDLKDTSDEDTETLFRKLASKRVTHFDKPLSRIYLLKNCRGMKGIFFVVSHLILDSWGICNFFKDVMGIYEALKNSEELPKPPSEYKSVMEEELNYINTPQYARDKEFWAKEFNPDNEPMYTHLNGPKALDKARKKTKDPSCRKANTVALITFAAHEIHLISSETVMKMKDFCSQYRLPIQTMIMLAYRSYLSKVNRREKDVIFFTILARRGTVKEKNSGGSRVYFIPFRTVIDEDTTFLEALEIIAEKQSSIYKHSAINPLEVLELMKKVYNVKPTQGYSTGSLTFQPIPLVGPKGTKIHTKWYCNGAASNVFYATVMDDDGSGALRFYYEYQKMVLKPEKIRDFHNYMLRFIDAGINNKDTTLKELLNL